MSGLIFLILMSLNITLSYADENLSLKAMPRSIEDHYLLEKIDIASDEVKNSKYHFKCGGIGMIDKASSLDGDVYYFDESSRKLIGICSMGVCTSGDKKYVDCSTICPPPQWKANNCAK